MAYTNKPLEKSRDYLTNHWKIVDNPHMNTKSTSQLNPRPITSECGPKVGHFVWNEDDVGSSPTTLTI